MKKSKSAAAGYVRLAGSTKAAPPANKLETLNPNDLFDVTIRIRGRQSMDAFVKSKKRVKREDFADKFGATDKDMSAVEEFAHEYHLSIVESSKERRSVVLRGRVADFEQAFQMHLSHYQDAKGNVFRGRVGEISIPRNLKDIVEGVFGLDNRPHARAMFQVATEEGKFVSHAASPKSFTPDSLAKIYGFPGGVTGTGQCIGIIELGGGYRTQDINAYFSALGIPVPSVKAVSVDGAVNSPSTPDSADGEVMLDIEVAGAVAPGASMVVYFAPNTDQGFLDAITTAVHDTRNKPSVISISWGASENNWTTQSLNSFNNAFQAASLLGVTITVAAGDSGSSDGETDGKAHADFPASSPFVLACGGTKLTVKSNKISSEVVWHESSSSATGGGVSDFFPLPAYQVNAHVPVSVSTGFKGRGLPDVAGDADPNTGYQVRVDGQQLVIGGTSAVAPLMAGLIARINQQKARQVGFINPTLYSTANPARDITQGDNITTSTHKGYKAGPGWDACTGWGVLSKL